MKRPDIHLTKTDFILYRECPHNVWVKLNRPEEYAKFEISDFEKALGVMGNDVELLARGMFPDGHLIKGRDSNDQKLTKELIGKKTPVIFQAVFATDKYLSAADVLQWDNLAKKYDIYEIKMSSTEEDDDEELEDESKPKRVNKKRELQYEYDLAFQTNVIEECGVSIGKKYLVRLNREYKRVGDLDFRPGQLFIIEDKTEAINKLQPVASEEMERAHDVLSEPSMPSFDHICYSKGRSKHCTAFSYITKIPSYSVHDLNRIGNSKRYLKELLDEGILNIEDVPIDDRLIPKKPAKGKEPSKPRKLNQVKVHKSQEPIVDVESIRAELDSLQYPLYFLDYETYPTAIPPYSGYRPYQHIVFQYSLHVVSEKNAKPEHFECLILDGEPSERIVNSLRKHIGNHGTVISWYKKFENSRNKELSKIMVEDDLKKFILGLVDRTYDLMDIVENQYYVHPGFEGRSSIKKVLPVIARLMGHEEILSYKKLEVHNGTDAIEAYRKITTRELTGELAKEKEKHMLEYCKLDTYAMYEIWNHLQDLIK